MSEFVNLDPDAQFGCACCRPIWTLWTTSRRSIWMLWASSFANLDALDAEFGRPDTIWTLWTSRFVHLDALDAQALNLDALDVQALNLDALDVQKVNLDAQTLRSGCPELKLENLFEFLNPTCVFTCCKRSLASPKKCELRVLQIQCA